MSRGRRALPDEVKALKGNPGKRRLESLERASEGSALKADLPRVSLNYPEFLSDDREKEIFRRVVDDYLQRRVARAPDLTAYARWAAYLHRWWLCKEGLDGKATWIRTSSKHIEDMPRRHPLFKDMLDLERVLQSLEDRLGLNPVARQNIMRGLAAMPAALGGLFGEEPVLEGEKELPDDLHVEAQESPLSFLQNAGKLN